MLSLLEAEVVVVLVLLVILVLLVLTEIIQQ